ncbi:PREDICTED: uncharacterized protein LOC105449477 [Wasmannia auropunctata]|uniref:uncharacterized protein LOC105449477 n=1 Tax=Wasmannia auropunctata TaxID=64793 RepID=UPI0005EDEF76|nr:PREDICTED: uncharacterized protein LOC105449477 [Wasmannia auropunctata]
MAAYTNEEYYDMLMVLGECHGQYYVAARRYAELYPNRARHPRPNVILEAAQRLYETGSVLQKKKDAGRHRNARNLQNVETVLRAVEQEPEISIRDIAREYQLSYSTVQRILKEEKLHAYHYTRVQHLREEDYPQRRRFCEDFLRRVDEDPEFPSRVIFSDESLFTREGIFNSHNMHVWDEENPRVTRIRNYQVRWKLNVWAGIMGTNILGPVILPDTLNSVSYLEFLQENLPDFLEQVPLERRNQILFQQDGAGPHNARIVTNFLNQRFPGRWIGRYGPIHWPARSPDLNPLDFFLWGHCKEIVYRQLPEDIEELNDKLHFAIWDVDDEVMEKTQENLLRRMRACIAMDGGHFEHLL